MTQPAGWPGLSCARHSRLCRPSPHAQPGWTRPWEHSLLAWWGCTSHTLHTPHMRHTRPTCCTHHTLYVIHTHHMAHITLVPHTAHTTSRTLHTLHIACAHVTHVCTHSGSLPTLSLSRGEGTGREQPGPESCPGHLGLSCGLRSPCPRAAVVSRAWCRPAPGHSCWRDLGRGWEAPGGLAHHLYRSGAPRAALTRAER